MHWEGGGRRENEGKVGAWEELTGCSGSKTMDVSTRAACSVLGSGQPQTRETWCLSAAAPSALSSRLRVL